MSDRWRRVRAILEGALDRPEDERLAFVHEASAGDREVESEVIELLAAESADHRLGAAIAGGVVAQVAHAASQVALQPGATVGKFRLVRAIGQGGMGAVWEAQQDDPKRAVALKVMQHAFALPSEVSRFRFESEVLARLHHPNIAQVYEAGTFGSGQPYFAMEFVENARPICDYTSEKALTVRQRLVLLLSVADAVQHGHQRGVIHRDLKSANVLVDGHGHTKVIDFGIARGIGADPNATPDLTRTGQMVGTLKAMAPEQVEGKKDAIDVRTDVYALGVILCEILTGQLPIDFTDVNLLEAARRIQHQPPTLPSAVDPTLPKELDWVAGKALAKEKARRYASASEFAGDLRRFLDGEAVLAAPESRLYRARVFARRHRVGLTAAALVVIALAGGLGVALKARSKEQAARQRAESALTRAKSALAFVTNMLESVRPDEAGRNVRVRDMLAVADQDLARGFDGPPEVEAAVRASLGGSWLALDFTESAETHLVRALELREQTLGKDDPETLDSLRDLGRLRMRQGRAREAEVLTSEFVARASRALGPNHPDTLVAHADHATTLCSIGRIAEGVAEATAAERMLPENLPQRDPHRDDVEKTVAAALEHSSSGAEAVAFARKVYDRLLATLGPVHPRTLSAAGTLGRQLVSFGDSAGGLALMQKTLDEHTKQLGPDHDSTLYAEEALISVERFAGNLESCAKRLDEIIALRTKRDGKAYFRTLLDRALLGVVLGQLGQYPRARETFETAHHDAVEALGKDDPTTLLLATWHAQLLLDSDDVPGAQAILRDALASPAVVNDPRGNRSLQLKETLALTLRDPEHAKEGAALIHEVLAARRENLGPDCELTLGAMLHTIGFEALSGDLAGAEATAREALAGFMKLFGPKHAGTLATVQSLGTVLSMAGKLDEAAEAQRQALDIAAQVNGEGHPLWCIAAAKLGATLRQIGKPAEAEPLLARAAEAQAKFFGEKSGPVISSRIERCAALVEMGRITDAANELPAKEGDADGAGRALADALSKRTGGVAAPPDLSSADDASRAFVGRLADALDATGAAADAAKWRAAIGH